MTIHIFQSQNTSFLASMHNEVYVLDPLATITASAGLDGFYFALETTGITFFVEGAVRSSAQAHAAIFNHATGNKVKISQGGMVSGDFGIENYAGTLDVINAGLI